MEWNEQPIFGIRTSVSGTVIMPDKVPRLAGVWSDVATYSRRTIRKVEKYIKVYLNFYSHRKRRKGIFRKDL